jgi:Zn-dependent M28 family amino/carboxypeptidase
MANIVAVLPGRRPDVILIAGHYDTKWFREFTFVGANDGGSSAALLIELARAFASAARVHVLDRVVRRRGSARVVDAHRQPLRVAAHGDRSRKRPGDCRAR